MKGLITSLWFDGQAVEAAQFYTAIFKDGKIGNAPRWAEDGPGKKGDVMVAQFEIMGQKFIGINGGPQFKFSEAVSFVVSCDTQDEIDYYWDHLSGEGGQESMCGWLKDKFGLSWQIVPANMGQLMSSGDSAKTAAVTKAMMTMRKMDKAALEAAFRG